ncbi:MAG TPA: phytanoyl-CoA dioxygenase family protein [Acidimicrobiales bacterium]|jgi:ectoine hydroxylase-related dioxygenase (phytanoyl-CoA dioxygenase family)
MSVLTKARNRIRSVPRLVRAPSQPADGRKVLTQRQLDSWNRHGYLVLPRFFGRQDIKGLTSEVDDLWAQRRQDDRGLVIDVRIDTPEERRVRFKDAGDSDRDLPYKLNDVFLVSSPVRETVLDPQLVNVLDDLLEGAPMVCNSLTFERGSQQRFHFDTFYMPPLVPNKMLATWIALEDASDKAGPLRYYPGSHTIPPYFFSHGGLNAIGAEFPDFDRYIEPELASRRMKWTTFPARAGDVFIWHAQLYHGGAPIKDMSRTRKSLVTHYFRAQDTPAECVEDIGGGRYYLRREHQSTQ